MGLLFTGDFGFEQRGQPQWDENTWDLDQLVVPFRGSVDDLESFLTYHSVGEPSGIDGNMYLMKKPSDGHKQFPTVDMTYQGKRAGVLPPQKHESDKDVLSSSSKLASNGFRLSQPLVVEFYAPTNILTYYSRGAAGTIEVDDPVEDIEAISVYSFDQNFVVGEAIQAQLALYFSIVVTKSSRSIEIVPNQYWFNASKKTKHYTPFLFNVPSGPFLTLFSPGIDYEVDDILTITAPAGHGFAVVKVTQVFQAFGDPTHAGVYRWIVQSNNITDSWNALPASGGSGSGCAFNVIQIP